MLARCKQALASLGIVHAHFDTVLPRRRRGVYGQAIVVNDDLAGRPTIGQPRSSPGFGIALADDMVCTIQHVQEGLVAPDRRAVRLPEERDLGNVARRQLVVEQAIAQQRDLVARLGVLQRNVQHLFGRLGCLLGYGIDDQSDIAVPGIRGLVRVGVQPTLNESLWIAFVRGPQDGKDPLSRLRQLDQGGFGRRLVQGAAFGQRIDW